MSDNRRMPKGSERRDERITIRVPQSIRAALDAAAEAEMRSVSDVIVLCVMKQLGVKPKRMTKRKGAR
jgi:uncharacterized protein (DUF1778 family)